MTGEQAIDRVIAGDYCIGCGACAALEPTDFTLELDTRGCWQARARRPAAERERDLSPLCPMSGAGPDEDTIATELFPDLPHHDAIGAHAFVGAGWVAEGDFRLRGSSGGLLTWLACRLLESGQVDEIVQVAPRPGGPGEIFAYAVSDTPEAVRAAAKSRYYPVQARDVLAHIRQGNRRVAVLALPCFAKMIRLLAADDPAIGRNVTFVLGLICGHLKSARFAELLAWQKGIAPAELGAIDFRDKIEGRPATGYGFRAWRRPAADDASDEVAAPMAGLVGHDWGQGMMKYPACDFCDDVLAECADVAVGDAWLPGWREDWRGTNVVVARHAALVAMLDEGRRSGALAFTDLSPDEAVHSQAAGLRHRREGLAHRLWRRARAGHWTPRKRSLPTACAAASGADLRFARGDPHRKPQRLRRRPRGRVADALHDADGAAPGGLCPRQPPLARSTSRPTTPRRPPSASARGQPASSEGWRTMSRRPR